MKYKMLALDLDETLLNKNLSISHRNIKAIKESIKHGILVILATGRMFRSAHPYALQINTNIDFPIVVYHGAVIKTVKSNKLLNYKPVPFQEALRILQFAEDEDIHVNLYLDDRLFVKEHNKNTRYYQSIASVEVEEVGSLLEVVKNKNQDPVKLTIIDMDEARFEQLQHRLEAEYSSRLSIMKSRPHFLEITAREATKGQALAFLSRQEGISPGEVIAIGDSYNDIDMLEYAGVGVAVDNAPAEVKEAADIITAPNTEDGVARFLEDYVFV